jgi:hypothetical protein
MTGNKNEPNYFSLADDSLSEQSGSRVVIDIAIGSVAGLL